MTDIIMSISFLSAFFQCYICHATQSVVIDRGRIAEPAVCSNCEALYSMTLIHNRSYFTDKQVIKLQESPGKAHVHSASFLFPFLLQGKGIILHEYSNHFPVTVHLLLPCLISCVFLVEPDLWVLLLLLWFASSIGVWNGHVFKHMQVILVMFH